MGNHCDEKEQKKSGNKREERADDSVATPTSEVEQGCRCLPPHGAYPAVTIV